MNGSSKGRAPASAKINGVSKAYGEAWERQQVVDNFNLDILPGKLTAFVGPSGCGKSTLVNLLAGFEQPDEGEITVNEKRVSGPSNDRMVVFQETALLPWLTTLQNVSFGPKLRNDMSRDQLNAEASRIIDIVGLSEFKDKYPLQLSFVMQRRAELARAMMNHPILMIMY